MRNGPNPIVKSLPYHWFDGDGCIFAVTFVDNATVLLENRWIRTDLLAVRNRTGSMRSFLAEIQYPWRALRAILLLVKGQIEGTSLKMTTGNTALLWHQKKLLALVRLLSRHCVSFCHASLQMEAAHPIEIDPVTLETRGMVVLPGMRSSLTAHPKFDRAADELVSFGYIPPSSAVHYYVHRGGQPVHVGAVEFAETAEGKLYSRMPHDFACTERWSLFYDSPPIRLHPLVLFGLSGAADPVPARLVFVPRHNSSAVRAVAVEPGAVFHFANAFEENGVVTVIGCKSNQTGSYFNLEANRHIPYLYEWRVDVQRGVLVSERFLPSQLPSGRVALEFPSVNERFAMRKTRFTYGMTIAADSEEHEGGRALARYDHEQERATLFELPGGDWRFQEPLFVGSGAEAEEAGSLVTFVFNRASGLSSLLIVDAATMGQTALVPLGTRVPMGFHTLFLSRAAAARQ